MASENTVLSWTPANWITVLLMVFLGYFILGAGVKIWQQKRGMATA